MYSQTATLKPVSQALIAAFARVGVRIGPASTPDLIASTCGFWTANLAREYNTPYVLGPAPMPAVALPAHLHLGRVIDRVKLVARVEDAWKAQELAAITLKVVRENRVRVDTHAVLFDPCLAGVSTKILKAMNDPDFPPVQASVAIGSKDLPCPPRSLDKHLELIGPERNLPFGGNTVVEDVARYETHLWQKPVRGIREIDPVYLDTVDMRDNKPVRAELGLGFCLVLSYPSFRQPTAREYRIVAPILHSTAHDPEWHTSAILSSELHESARVARGERSLPDLIGSPVSDLPRVEVCPACMGLFAHVRGVAKHACDAGGPDARRIVDVVRARFDSGKPTFTAAELRADVPSRRLARGQPGQGLVNVDAIEAFLHTHRATLGIRSFEGTWRVMRKPTIDLGARRSPEAAAQSAGA